MVRYWDGYLSGMSFRSFACGQAGVTAMTKACHLSLHVNPDWFYPSGTGLPRLSWKTGHYMGVCLVSLADDGERQQCTILASASAW